MNSLRRAAAIIVIVAASTSLAGCAAGSSSSGPAAVAGSTAGSGAGTATGTSGGAPTVSAEADRPVRSTGCGHPSPYPVGRTVTEAMHSGGRLRHLVLHVPTDYDPARPMPLVLAFHARGGSGTGMATYTGLSAAHAIVAYPTGVRSQGQRSWQSAPYASDADDVAFVAALITHLQAGLCVDPDRVDAAGKSNGGGFTALLACALPDRIAAFGIVSGAFYETPSARCAHPVPTPVVEFHGTADTTIRYRGGTSHGDRYRSVPGWLRSQAEADGCDVTPTSRPVATGVTELTWSGCAGRGALVHYRVDGGGHTWPGAQATSGPGVTTRAISATQVMLAFFASHPLHSAV
jgi:polyhydroxybutyrate depolymerase